MRKRERFFRSGILFLLCLITISAVQVCARSAESKDIVFVGRDDYFDPVSGELADQQFITDLEDAGHYVIPFYNQSLGSGPQSDFDILESADLIIIARSAASMMFADPNKAAWNAVTTPILNLNLWNERNTRMNWFNTESVSRNNTIGDTLMAVVDLPDDPVFAGLDVSDSVAWAIGPYDYIGLKDAGYGTVVVRSSADSSVLFARFEPDDEFYEDCGDAPAGPRTIIGNGNDADTQIINFYNFTDLSRQVYLNEINRMLGIGTAVEACKPALPGKHQLAQNYPNPFNPSTQIGYSISELTNVTLTVYNSAGQVVNTLVSETLQPGQYQVQWNGLDYQGQAVSNGIYLYKLQAGAFSQVRRMMMMK